MKVPWVDEPPDPSEAEEDSLVELTERELKHLRRFQKSNGRFPSREEILELLRKVRRSKKFREWNASKGTGTFERHFTPQQLANDWGLDVEPIRNLFRNESGVIKLGDKNPKHKRAYLTLRIPESVAQRVHKRISA